MAAHRWVEADRGAGTDRPWRVSRWLLPIGAAVVSLHGLIHVLGLVAYWPLADVASLPYRTTLLDGRWAVGASGMRGYGALWLAAALGYAAAVAGLASRQGWWRATMAAVTLLSLVITALDWRVARAGAVVDVAILVVLLLGLRRSDERSSGTASVDRADTGAEYPA